MRRSLVALVLLLALVACTATAFKTENLRSRVPKSWYQNGRFNRRLVANGLKQYGKKKLTRKSKTPAAAVQDEAQADSLAALSSGDTLKATTGLNIRSGPCTTNAIVGGLSSGQTTRFTGQTSTGCGYTWYSVNGGWVAKDFVTVIASGGGGGGGGSGELVSVDKLRAIMPNLSVNLANQYNPHLNDAMKWGGITTCARKAAFLAQLAHESGQFRYMEEIASGAAYEGRKDLGNIYPGDGVRYKGRGPIQLTGRSNYRTAGQALGVDLEGNPTLAATPQWGFKVAAWYWTTRGLNGFADQNNQGAFDTITKRINGGTNGKADRDRYWYKAKSVLGC